MGFKCKYQGKTIIQNAFPVQKRTPFIDINTFQVTVLYQVSASLILTAAKTFHAAEAVSPRGTSKVSYDPPLSSSIKTF